MDTLVGGHYQAARAICDDLERAFPAHPAGLYGRIAISYAHMVDLEDTVGRAEFMELCDSCIDACDAMRNAGNESRAVLSYLRGSALGARGLLLNHEGKTLPALKALIKAKNAFEDAIDADPQFYDAYLGRGAYRYAVATHASLLRWLPLIPKKSSGWQDLWTAARYAAFSRSTALTSIVWHTMDEGDFTTADSIIQSQLQRFPGCRNFLWPKLSFYERQERWAEAEQTANLLLDQYLALPENNGYEPIGLYWRMMTCADALGRPNDALAFARAGLDTYRTPDVAERRAGRLRDLQARLSKP
ncbi:MAG TPA: hypothetical protein VGL38_10385 [bacterium]|jgi:tetratricopeptide (TPR) repeat protein